MQSRLFFSHYFRSKICHPAPISFFSSYNFKLKIYVSRNFVTSVRQKQKFGYKPNFKTIEQKMTTVIAHERITMTGVLNLISSNSRSMATAVETHWTVRKFQITSITNQIFTLESSIFKKACLFCTNNRQRYQPNSSLPIFFRRME